MAGIQAEAGWHPAMGKGRRQQEGILHSQSCTRRLHQGRIGAHKGRFSRTVGELVDAHQVHCLIQGLEIDMAEGVDIHIRNRF